MAKHNILGKNGEKIAAEYLVKQGYDIRDINWRNGRYEIDIVATQGKYLVIVEVKTRQSDIFGLPEDAINDKKISIISCLCNIFWNTNIINGRTSKKSIRT